MIKINNKTIHFEKFPNGETKVDEKSIQNAVLYDNTGISEIVFRYENDTDLIHLYMLKSYIDRYKGFGIQRNKLHLAYMPYSRNDRVENISAFTLKYISDFINQMNFDEVVIYEAHSDVSLGLVNNSKNYSLVQKLFTDVVADIDFNFEKDYIVFPDITANKRYGNLGSQNQLTGLKHRNFETGKIENLELVGEVKHNGFKALMLDDLCSYGGTFLRAAEQLRKKGATEIYLLVGHSENNIYKGDIFKSENIQKVYTTDSILTEFGNWENMKYKNKIKVYNIEDIIYAREN